MSFSRFPITELNILPARLVAQGKRGPTLYLQGSPGALELLERLPEYGLGVVGTRRPQVRALELTRKTISRLRGSRLVIISGLALGIDAQAHEAALAAELPTIAVLGNGLGASIYPRSNQGLALRILERGGLLVSEYPPGTEPKPWMFVQRNRWIAAWSKATWIVQAATGSGALLTADYAQDHHRDLYCTPAFPGDEMMSGNEEKIDVDAAIPLWNAGSLGQTWMELAHLGRHAPTQTDLPLPHSPSLLDDTERLILGWIQEEGARGGGARFERIFERALQSELSPADTQRAAQRLVTLGFIREVAGSLIST